MAIRRRSVPTSAVRASAPPPPGPPPAPNFAPNPGDEPLTSEEQAAAEEQAAVNDQAASDGVATDPFNDGVVDRDRLADPDSENENRFGNKLGVRLDQYTPEEAKEVDAHAIRVYEYNLLAKAEGRPQAVTREEMDRIP